MSWLKNLVSGGASKLVESVGDALDKNITNKEELAVARKEITQVITDKLGEIIKEQASIIKSEASGNFLQKSWRPIVMLSFASIVVYSKFIAPAFGLPNTELEPDFWAFLQAGLGGYVIGRSVEKVADKVSQIDLSKIRK